MNGQGTLSTIIRKFLARLIVDVIIEYYQRTKTDPAFSQKLQDAFTRLNAAGSDEEDHAAAKALQDIVES